MKRFGVITKSTAAATALLFTSLAVRKSGEPLPPRYWRFLWIWTSLGVPAFFGLVIVFYLMVAKPV